MSNDLLVFENKIIDRQKPIYMVAGFHQWANAGNVSSGVPEYLIEKLHATKIGRIRKGDFYLYQLPGSHYLFRPQVKYIEGYEQDYQKEPVNDFYYAEIGDRALIIFIGTEPNQNEDSYINILLDVAQELHIKRIMVPAGVGGEVPFSKDRRISCTYSLKQLREELNSYAVNFSNYDKNATIGMVINHYCKSRDMEAVRMTAMTPSYQFSIAMSSDKRAIYDILRRTRHMFNVDLDLNDLEKESEQQLSEFNNALRRLFLSHPELESQITTYLEQIEKGFKELKFAEPTKIPDAFLKEFDK